MYPAKRRPNIVFIVLDTHRLDRLGCYGYPRGTSPNLDAFANGATLFERAVAPAQWTIPSHASMFTGEPPSTHMTVQSSDALDPRFKTLAEHLRSRGYQTAGFCNNPLVGVINNGFKRGFDTFFNYGGAIPSKPAKQSTGLFSPLNGVWERYTQVLRKISYPIQNAFANSDRLFEVSVNPFWVPLWTRFAHFKGDTQESVRDATRFVREGMASDDDRPQFLFINLMETHLPYSAPDNFVKTFAPILREEREALDFMRVFNTQALHWITPMAEPYSSLEAQTLSDMYDAEVAYQDHVLAQLLAALDEPEHRDNTMVIFVADHGEVLGEHQMMGHAFGVYQELVRVLMLIRFPGQMAGKRISTPVSATHLFHTALDVAGVEEYETHYSPAVDVRSQSLTRESSQSDKSAPVVFSEAYAPEHALKITETHKPDLIEPFSCRASQWAVYQDGYRLVRVEDVTDELFTVEADAPLEIRRLEDEAKRERMQYMNGQLKQFLEKAQAHRLDGEARGKTDLENEMVRQRLRNLGYLE
jgi:uncharacterized sulfatase